METKFESNGLISFKFIGSLWCVCVCVLLYSMKIHFQHMFYAALKKEKSAVSLFEKKIWVQNEYTFRKQFVLLNESIHFIQKKSINFLFMYFATFVILYWLAV